MDSANHENTSGPSQGADRPKRGAFPTPQHEIDVATPFVPAADETADRPNDGPDVDDRAKADDEIP